MYGLRQGGAETEPSPDWRRSHSGSRVRVSRHSCLGATGRHVATPAHRPPGLSSRVGYSRGKTRPRAGGLGPPSPLDRPMVTPPRDETALVELKCITVRKDVCPKVPFVVRLAEACAAHAVRLPFPIQRYFDHPRQIPQG